jgi:hypothetical protein
MVLLRNKQRTAFRTNKEVNFRDALYKIRTPINVNHQIMEGAL